MRHMFSTQILKSLLAKEPDWNVNAKKSKRGLNKWNSPNKILLLPQFQDWNLIRENAALLPMNCVHNPSFVKERR